MIWCSFLLVLASISYPNCKETFGELELPDPEAKPLSVKSHVPSVLNGRKISDLTDTEQNRTNQLSDVASNSSARTSSGR